MPPEAAPFNPLILPGVFAGLLVILIFMALGLRSRLVRIERLLGERKEHRAQPTAPEVAPEVAEGAPGGPFEEFLHEDPERRLLSKKEQSSAYRKWRQEKGMNWSNS